jgi:hypothetical protein
MEKSLILVASPKTTTETVFVYKSLSDLENLIAFVGSAPQVKVEKGVMILNYKKHEIKPNTVVFRNSFGEVVHTLPAEKFAENYEIRKEVEFSKDYINKVAVKPVKERKPRESKK